MRVLACVALMLVTIGCASPPDVEATSLLGEPLHRPAFPAAQRRSMLAKLHAAERAARAQPDSESAAIWHGRRLAYLGRYQEAIDVYTRAIEQHPDSYRLRRHRGHRYITVRRFEEAVADLEEAARLCADARDELEPDGMPNAWNVPRTTDKFNIYYHLGIAHYLLGQFAEAAKAFESCRGHASRNDDMVVALANWQYMTLRRLGRQVSASAVLEPIHADMDVIENHDYLELLLMYKREVMSASVIESALEAGGVSGATKLYGVGNWRLYHNEPVRARAMFQAVLATDAWSAFGYAAAEAEVARRDGG